MDQQQEEAEMTDDRKRSTGVEVELLPLYDELQGHPKLEIIKHYARANVDRALAESRAEVAQLREIARHAYRVAVLCDPYVRARQHPASNSLEALAFNLRGEIDALNLEPNP